jgi:pilus assembly protein CpaB
MLLIGAVGLAALAALLAFGSLRAMDSGDGGLVAAGEVDVVVADRRINSGETISGDMLKVTSLPENALIENALTSLVDTEGTVARVTLQKGEQLTNEKLGLTGDGSGSSLADTIPIGERAVSVEVTEQKIFGGLVAPGDHVDVMAVVEDFVDQTQLPRAVLLVQDAEVLAVADQALEPIVRTDRSGTPLEGDSAGNLSERPEDLEAQPKANNVTLAVTPSEALMIALAQEKWAVYLSLRGGGDTEIIDVRPQLLDFNE